MPLGRPRARDRPLRPFLGSEQANGILELPRKKYRFHNNFSRAMQAREVRPNSKFRPNGGFLRGEWQNDAGDGILRLVGRCCRPVLFLALLLP